MGRSHALHALGRSSVLALTLAVIAPLPLSTAQAFSGGFIENRGQLDGAVRYYMQGPDAAIYFTPQALVIDLEEHATPPTEDLGMRKHELGPLPGDPGSPPATRRGCAVYIRFDGGAATPVITAEGPSETRYNFLRGPDPDGWRLGVPAYEEVRYREIWPGIDLVFHMEGAALAYGIEASPGADTSRVAFRYEGALAVRAAGAGCLGLETGIARLEHRRTGLAGEFKRATDDRPESRGSVPTPPDNPSALVWSTFMGGHGVDYSRSVALDAAGDVLVTGADFAPDFPTTPGAYDTSFNGLEDAFVAKITARGNALLWSTFIGGSRQDWGTALALDASGNIVLTGYTWSADFPVSSGSYDTSFNGGYTDAFVAKISPTGSALLWGTFLGGSGDEGCEDLALDPAGNPVVTGSTESPDFPTTPGAFDTHFNGGLCDAFVAKLASTGSSLLWSSYLGGGGDYDEAYGVAVDGAGNPVVVGGTTSPDFPTTPGAFDTSFNLGLSDAFVTKFAGTGSSLIWSTFLGGTCPDNGTAIALDAAGGSVVTGMTMSPDFPTTVGAYQRQIGWRGDAFVTKIVAGGNALVWSTYLGGNNGDEGDQVALERWGNAVISGYTESTDFPTTPGSFDREYNGGSTDVFLAELSATGARLLYGTYLGGEDQEYAPALALTASGDALVSGWTLSPDFPTSPGDLDPAFTGNLELFATKLRLSSLVAPENCPLGALGGPPASTGASLDVTMIPGSAEREIIFHSTDAAAAPFSVRLYDVAGRLVRSLPGETWDGNDERGVPARPGVYFYQAALRGRIVTGKFVIAR